MGIASELGYLDVPEGVLIDIDMLNRYPREKVVLITTGSQGEPMSALSRMAFADHRKVEVGPGDCIYSYPHDPSQETRKPWAM